MSMKGYVPDPIASAKRNLSARIEDFLRKPSLTPFEELHVERAQECLSEGRYREGEGHMHKAERPDIYQPHSS